MIHVEQVNDECVYSYSALRVNGQRMYDLARKGELDESQLPKPRNVMIHSIDLVKYSPDGNSIVT